MKLLEKQHGQELADAIGGRIRAAREAAGLTLKAVAQATGLSQPFLSRLERGQVSASIANLLEIARALGVSISELLEGEVPGPGQSWVVHRGGTAVPGDGYSFHQIAAGLRGRRMDAFVLDFPPRRAQELTVAHEGEELLYVLEGRVRFQFGDKAAVLDAGDAVQFDSSLPHSAANVGSQSARLLMVTAPARAQPFGWLSAPAVTQREKPRRT